MSRKRVKGAEETLTLQQCQVPARALGNTGQPGTARTPQPVCHRSPLLDASGDKNGFADREGEGWEAHTETELAEGLTPSSQHTEVLGDLWPMREVGWIKSLSFTWAGVQPQNSSPKTRSHERKKIARQRIIHTSLSHVGLRCQPRCRSGAGAPRCPPAHASTCLDPAQPRCLCPSEGRCPAPELLVSAAGVRGGGRAELQALLPQRGGEGPGDHGQLTEWFSSVASQLPPRCCCHRHPALHIPTQQATFPSSIPQCSPGLGILQSCSLTEGVATPSQTVCNVRSSAPGQV